MSGYNDDTLDEFPPFGSSRPSIYHEPQRRERPSNGKWPASIGCDCWPSGAKARRLAANDPAWRWPQHERKSCHE